MEKVSPLALIGPKAFSAIMLEGKATVDTNRSRIYILQCSATKLSKRAPAKQLYSSPLFSKSFAAAASDLNGKIYIFSALHGLIHPDAEIEPYDVTLSGMKPADKRAWAARVITQLQQLNSCEAEVVMLAGMTYSDPIDAFLNDHFRRVFYPLRGLGIGRRLAWLGKAIRVGIRIAVDLEEFYLQLDRLCTKLGMVDGLPELAGRKDLPQRGVYFFMEPRESRARGQLRVVRVGTHAVSSGSKATLRSRLRTHLGTTAGLGSHRSSVFRRHVGVAIARSKGKGVPATWGRGQTATSSVLAAERWLENEVSKFMAATRVAWINVADESGPDSDRAFIERNAIALLVRGAFLNEPSDDWLGRWSDRPSIVTSGIWNVDHTDADYDPRFIDVFTQYVNNAQAAVKSPLTDEAHLSLAPAGWRAREKAAGLPTLW